jgi:hypothetical protein
MLTVTVVLLKLKNEELNPGSPSGKVALGKVAFIIIDDKLTALFVIPVTFCVAIVID